MEAHRRREAVAIIKYQAPEWFEKRGHLLCQLSTAGLEAFAKQLSDIAFLQRYTDEHGHGGI
jgi:hypothetical protein